MRRRRIPLLVRTNLESITGAGTGLSKFVDRLVAENDVEQIERLQHRLDEAEPWQSILLCVCIAVRARE